MLNYVTILYHAALFSAGIQLHNVTDVAFTSENTQTTTTQGPVDIRHIDEQTKVCKLFYKPIVHHVAINIDFSLSE